MVELNRAVAVGMAFGPAAGLDLVDALVSEPSLKAYHLLPAVRGDLLRKLGPDWTPTLQNPGSGFRTGPLAA